MNLGIWVGAKADPDWWHSWRKSKQILSRENGARFRAPVCPQIKINHKDRRITKQEFPVVHWVKDLALSMQRLRPPQWLGFSPWPRNLHMTQVQSLASFSGLRIQYRSELRCRSATTAPIHPLAWKLLYAPDAALAKKCLLIRLFPSPDL